MIYFYLICRQDKSHSVVFCEKDVLKDFAKFTKKTHQCQSLFLQNTSGGCFCTRRVSHQKRLIIIFVGSSFWYCWYMLLLLNSEFHCQTKLTIPKSYVSKFLLWINLNSVTTYLVSNDSLMCFLVYGELMT